MTKEFLSIRILSQFCLYFQKTFASTEETAETRVSYGQTNRRFLQTMSTNLRVFDLVGATTVLRYYCQLAKGTKWSST